MNEVAMGNNMDIYLVGGAVRDELLGRPVGERDWVVVGASPRELLDQGFKQVGKDFPVFLHPETHEEYALARTERKTAPGYYGFAIDASSTVTLEEDLRRRDLTVNAMARDREGRLVDPYGGAADLAARRLRHMSPAFAEDPVRVLRVARFAARYGPLGFQVADETLELMRAMVDSGEVDALVAERVWAETVRALGEAQPRRFVEVLRDCGALARVFPELDRLFGVPQPERHHPEVDTGVHLLLCLDQAVRLGLDIPARFAVLVHDLGKGLTPMDQWPRHIGHESRGAKLVREFCQRLRVPNEYRDLAALVAEYHTHCHRALELRPITLLKVLQALDGFRKPDRLRRFLGACEADARGRAGLEDRDYPQAALVDQALTAARAVAVEPLVARGLRGEALVQAIVRERRQAIAGVMETFRN